MSARQIVSIWLPNLAMEHWRGRHEGADPAVPRALVSESRHGFTIDAVNAAAREGGAMPAMRLADARAIFPALAAEPSEPQADAALIARFALWARRWGPWTAADGADGLLADVTGAAHLFGGEAAVLADMRARFAALGFTARAAMAPTIGAAWALARHGDAAPCAPGDVAARLAPLPVEALRLDPASVLLLRRLGLKSVGALAAVPRLSLARRFRGRGEPCGNPLVRLDQATGRAAEHVAPVEAEPLPRAARRVADPVLHVSILAPILADLAGDLGRQLEPRRRGARRLLFEAYRVDGHVARLEAALARPARDPAHMAKLFDERLEGLDAGFGFDAFALAAAWHEPMDARQPDLAGEASDEEALPRLADRLALRLGARNVRRPVPRQSHMPERAVAWRDPLAPVAPAQDDLPFHERPLRLFPRPEPIAVIYATPQGLPRRFRWRRASHRIVRAEGPERIAPEWWRERSTARLRDYYRVEDEAGRRFWIYRHGLAGDGRGGAPAWYLHGLFA